MGEREKVVRLLRRGLAPAFKAVLGRGDGVVAVPGRPGYVWCRKLGRTELLIIAYNRSGSTSEGTTVLVKETTLEGATGYEVIDLFVAA